MKQIPKRLDTKKAAEYLTSIGVKVTPGSLEVFRCQGRGPAYIRIGRRIFYTPDHLDKYVQGQVVETIDSINCG